MTAMAARRKAPEPSAPAIDTSTIRHLLTLTPEERIRLAAEDARNLRRFELEVEKAKGR
jgi:hypothetical protein